MLWIDKIYAQRLSLYLRNFKQKGDYLWAFSCPICGDSAKNKSKTRGYIFRQKTGLFYRCHNCGYSTNLGTLIKSIDSNLYSEYVLERFNSTPDKYNSHKKIEQAIPELAPVKLKPRSILSKIKSIDKLPIDHPVVNYMKKRCIPSNNWNMFYYAPKFFSFVNDSIKKQFDIKKDHPRLIIPFYKENGELFAIQGRAFGSEQPKYITIKIDEEYPKIFGLERVDWNKTVYVTEGPIDSIFLPNAIAVSGASFDYPILNEHKDKLVIISDNEPRSSAIVQIIDKNIKNGYNVCLLPETIKEKDINDIIQSGKKIDWLLSVITNNTFSGLEANLKFTQWRKI